MILETSHHSSPRPSSPPRSHARAERSRRQLVNLRIRDKLSLLVLLFFGGVLVVGSTGIYLTRELSASLVQVGAHEITTLTEINRLQIAAQRVRAVAHEATLAGLVGNSDGVTHATQELAEAEGSLTAGLVSLSRSGSSEATETGAALERPLRGLVDHTREIVGLVSSADNEAALEKTVAFESSFQALAARIDGEAKKAVIRADSSMTGAIALGERGNGWMITAMLAVLFVGLTASYTIARGMIKPMLRTVSVLQLVAEGDLTARISLDRRDEIGQIGASLDRALSQLGDVFAGVADTIHSLTTSSEHFSSVSSSLSNHAGTTANQSAEAAAVSQSVTESVESVASASHEMLQCVHQLARNTSDVAKIAQNAVSVTGAATTQVTKLGESSKTIGEVVNVINSIAEQTNLLALNATIEAARAGEFGKGFAVVASEVKELARETSRATGEIAAMIGRIQDDSAEAIRAIAEISSIVSSINDAQGAIAVALEQQTASVAEISKNVTHAAVGCGNIRAAVSRVADVAKGTLEGAMESLRGGQRLSGLADELRHKIGSFKF
jgi:methyl-accepting chemotaxis protein